MLSATGLNIYDGAVWSLAMSLLGHVDEAMHYMYEYIYAGSTCQFPDIRGDATCRGLISTGECQDVDGSCGFCYGTGSHQEMTLPKIYAFTFRMISDYWAFDGTVDARCPEKALLWTWNDYRPVLGENSWANLIAPLQAAYLKYGTIEAIPPNDFSILMALNFIPALVKMKSTVGGIHYSPHNTIYFPNHDAGGDVSTENNVSLLSGLKMLRYILEHKKIHLDKMADINMLIDSITQYVKDSYDREFGFFRQGGSFNVETNEFEWANIFAVDCQTWAMSAISPLLIDQWFGVGTSLNIWKTTKRLGGYKYQNATGSCEGLGFSDNIDQVFSGEWTLGASNMLRIFSNLYNDPSLKAEADFMLNNVVNQLTQTDTIDGVQVKGILYASKRHWIPFGWWANKLLSTVSTGWTVLLEKNYNPLHLGGEYIVDY